MKSRVAAIGYLHAEVSFRHSQLALRADWTPSQNSLRASALIRAIRLSRLAVCSLQSQTSCPPQTGSVGAARPGRTAERRVGPRKFRSETDQLANAEGVSKHASRAVADRLNGGSYRPARDQASMASNTHRIELVARWTQRSISMSSILCGRGFPLVSGCGISAMSDANLSGPA